MEAELVGLIVVAFWAIWIACCQFTLQRQAYKIQVLVRKFVDLEDRRRAIEN